MSVDIQEMTAELTQEAERQQTAYRPEDAAQPQKMQKLMRRAAQRAAWVCERLKA